MGIWQTLKFGARAVYLEHAAAQPPARILRVQERRLHALVRHARQHSDLWREKLAHLDGDNFSLADLPTSNKAEVMDNFDRALTEPDITRSEIEAFFQDEANLGRWFKDKYALSHTSGSQGQPLLIVQTKEELELLFALQASRGNHRDLGIAAVAEHFGSPARLAAVTLKPGFYPSAAAIQYVPEGARQFIEVLQLSSVDEGMPDRLAEFKPTHLTSYASVLHELARQVEAGRLELKPDLVQVVNISERLMPKARKHYQDIFGAPVLDDYAMGECMFLTNGCADSGGMHVNADWAILEVVDDENRLVPPGEQGAKVLITNLANHVQPFIRYEVGDLVTMATEPCQCGSNLPLVAKVGGRDSDMFYIDTPEGRKPLTPIVFEYALTHIVDAREYQIVQEENTRFRLRIEPLPGTEIDHDRANQIVHEHLANYGLEGQLQVEIEVVDKLGSDGNAKFKRVVSKVAEGEKQEQQKDGEQQGEQQNGEQPAEEELAKSA